VTAIVEARGATVRAGAQRSSMTSTSSSPQEFVAIVGPNGAGESTLLAAIAAGGSHRRGR
jgi:ABC-type Mn2+/Zn2+ transport system ATPase subunit